MKTENKPTSENFDLKAEIISWIQIFVLAALIAFCLNHFIIANSRVPTGSMENTIMTHDRVFGSRLSYLFHDPERGDVTIFYFPDDPKQKTYYVKRIIGLPGDVIDIHDGHVYLNGSSEPYDEPYLKEAMDPTEVFHFEVPEGCYFMMGDNRNASADARYWKTHFVKREKLIAKVLVRYFPKPSVIH